MSVYLIRGVTGVLAPDTAGGDDTLYANQRFDGQTLQDAHFTQCTFANISFLGSHLVGCQFRGCVFEGCYFRKTQIRESTFPASRFIGCDFVKPTIIDSNFGYARFDRTAIPFASMEPSWPPLANVCADLAGDLAVQATALGNDNDARHYRLTSIARKEEALRRAWRGADEYSRDKYRTSLDRISALGQLLVSKTNGVLWGYGESMGRLLVNFVLISCVVFPVLYLLTRTGVHTASGSAVSDAWLLSLSSILNNSGGSGVVATGAAEAFVLIETAVGLIFLGLFVTYLFRAVTRR